MANLQGATWLSTSTSFTGKAGPNEVLEKRSARILDVQELMERRFAAHWMSRIDLEIECQERMAKHLKAREGNFNNMEARYRTWNQRWAGRANLAQKWRDEQDGAVEAAKAKVESKEAKSNDFLERRHRLLYDVPNTHLDERGMLLMTRSGSRRALDVYRAARLGTPAHSRKPHLHTHFKSTWEPHHGPRPHSYPGPLPC